MARAASRPRFCRFGTWIGFTVLLAVLPWIFRSSLGYLVSICLSYNTLLAQGGLLSFGHAVYSGLGSFLAVHAMNLATKGTLPLPIVVIPLVGGLSGLFFAALLGYVTTKKSGTTFAMITLGIGELVAAMSGMFPGFFGGEGGVTTNRVYGKPLLGLTFGPQIQVYYLVAAYCFVSTALMFALTKTPLGRMLNAVRDNPERVEFIGYNTQRVRYLGFIISGFFAGIGGALATINFEIVNASDALSAARSGGYLLFTVLGGATFFFGPMIGAVLLVLASVLLSEVTKAWLLYFGLVFLFMVMYAPGGIASLVMMNVRVAKFGKFARLLRPYAGLLLSGLLVVAGASALIEMIYHIQLNAGTGSQFRFVGVSLDTENHMSWLVSAAVLAVGLVGLEFARRAFVRVWSGAQEEIEAEIKQREPA